MLTDFPLLKLGRRVFINPYASYLLSILDDSYALNQNNREVPICVSIFSVRENFRELALTIFSLLNQDIKPDKVVLWLDEEYEDMINLPYEITRFVKNGVEIRFVKSIGNYTDTIYPLKEFGGMVNVIAKPGVYYKKSWLKKLYISYISHPDDIQVHRAFKLNIENKNLLFEKKLLKSGVGFDIFINPDGGVLYPPMCFSPEALRGDVYSKKCPVFPALWFWFMSLVHDRKIRVVDKAIRNVVCIDILKTMFSKNIDVDVFKEEFSALFKLYGNNILYKLNRKE